MNPLIRIQPSKDGGRRSLTDECKATVAAWLHMMMKRLERQGSAGPPGIGTPTANDRKWHRQVIESRIYAIGLLIGRIDHAFDADAFAESWLWATEVMYGTAVDPAGGGSPGDDIGDRTGSP